MHSLLRARPLNRSVISATPTSPPPPLSLSRSKPSAAVSLPKPPLDFPPVLVVVVFSKTTGLAGWALSGSGHPMVAFSVALSKQCPLSPTSPQVRDPTLDMAMIQTEAPPYNEVAGNMADFMRRKGRERDRMWWLG